MKYKVLRRVPGTLASSVGVVLWRRSSDVRERAQGEVRALAARE